MIPYRAAFALCLVVAPMGLAFDGTRLAVGTTIQVWEFVDVPAVTAKLEPLAFSRPQPPASRDS